MPKREKQSNDDSNRSHYPAEREPQPAIVVAASSPSSPLLLLILLRGNLAALVALLR